MSITLQPRGSTEYQVEISGGATYALRSDSGFGTQMVVVGGPRGAPGCDGVDAASADIQLTAADALGGHRVIAVNELGEAVYADPEDPELMMPVGLSLGAAAAGEPITVRPFGIVEESSWNWSIGFIWVGSNGTLVQEPPPSPGSVVILGSVVGSARLRIAPQLIARC